ncbi:uracil-DNA glycosylase, family 4 [Opitutaceae bacterium TAV1]|nr:uracil-DNA glycosylase, family 4 [Opitutaceae bacterium TAV1]
MRASLRALTDELKRLKADGVTALSVSPESIALLREAVGKLQAASPSAGATGSDVGIRRSGGVPAPRPAVRIPAAAPAPELPPPPEVTLPAGDKAARWAWLKDFVTGHPVCRAHVRPGKKAVLGVGSLDAKIMFVGEAPGAEEEVQGEPFVGPAGQLLTRMIAAMGLKREQVYIGNIMNWRPQIPTPEGHEQIGNRPPSPEEMTFCLPFFRAQVEIVDPDVLVALGSTAAQGMLGVGSFTTLGSIRGRWREFGGKPLMVTYHPSYILRNQSSRSKRMIWEDLLKVMERVGLPVSEKQRGYFL